MTLSQIIKLRTNNGRTIVDFLVDVMQDRADDFRMCHRLQAARLLNTYGNEDAPDFIADNSQAPQSDRDKHRPRRPTTFDAELARVIREDTNDGRSIARFLVNVMEGELRTFRPHHRMAAARELLDRGFGKSARAEKVVRPRIKSRAAYDTVEGSKLADEHPLTPHSSRPPVVPAESLPRRDPEPEPRGGRAGRFSLITPLHSLPETTQPSWKDPDSSRNLRPLFASTSQTTPTTGWASTTPRCTSSFASAYTPTSIHTSPPSTRNTSSHSPTAPALSARSTAIPQTSTPTTTTTDPLRPAKPHLLQIDALNGR